MYEREPSARAEVLFEPTKVSFGDVIQPLRHGEPTERLAVVVGTAETHLYASTILRDESDKEYLSGSATFDEAVEVIGHWDFDRIYDGIMYYWEEGGDTFPEHKKARMREILKTASEQPPVLYNPGDGLNKL